MEQELEQYYLNRFDMMSQQGWKDLVEDVNEMINSYNQVLNVKTVEDLYIKQGQLDILNWIVSLKDVSEQAYEELNRETDI